MPATADSTRLSTKLPPLPCFLPPAAAAQAELQCRAVLQWAQLVIGVLLPTLVAGYTSRAMAAQAPRPSQRAPQRGTGALPAAAALAQRGGAAVATAWDWLDGLLAEAAAMLVGDPFYFASGMWVLGGMCWVLAKSQALSTLVAPPA